MSSSSSQTTSSRSSAKKSMSSRSSKKKEKKKKTMSSDSTSNHISSDSSNSQTKSRRSSHKKSMSSGSSTKKEKKEKTLSSDSTSKHMSKDYSSSTKSMTKKSSDSSSKSKMNSSDSSKTKKKSDSSSKSNTKSSPSKSKPSSSKSKSKPIPSKSKSKPSPSKSINKPSSSRSKTKPSVSKSNSESRPSSPDSGKGKGMHGKGKGDSDSKSANKPSNAFVFEDEPCGQNVNGGCDSKPLLFGNINFDQTVIGEFGAVLDPEMETFERDSDWYLFDIDEPACVQATIASNYEGTVVLYEGSTCTNLVNVASGDTSGVPATYCFPRAGQFGVFVAPTFAVEEPCERDPFKYYLALEYIECGTCLIVSESPGCSDRCSKRVCKNVKSCCDVAWTTACVDAARELCDCEEAGGKIITEDEPCGESINGGCFDDPPGYSSIEFGQTVIGQYGAVLNPDENIVDQDSDWYLFDLDKPACVRATLDSIDSGDVVLFQGSTFDTDTCRDDLVNVASGDSAGDPAVYCFPEAGEYGVFVAPTFEDMSPCQGREHKYILTLENLDQCGTCLTENSSPGCANKSCESTVCELDKSCCDDIWDHICVQKAKLWCKCAGGETPDVVVEEEPCGKDINGGCTIDPPAFGNMELGQTLLGEYGAVFNADDDIYEQDSDWFLFNTKKDDTCVEAVLTSRELGEVVLFEGATLEFDSCKKDLLNVASGESGGKAAVYCFPDAGEYGVFIAPLFQDKTPCEGKVDTYTLTLNGLKCGTCFVEHDSPGCSDMNCRETVCEYDDTCCTDAWDETCVEKAKLWCDCSKPDKPNSGSSTHSSGKGKGGSNSSGDGKGQSSSNRSEKGKGGNNSFGDGKGQSSRSMKKSAYISSDSGKGSGSYPSDSYDSGKGKGYSPSSKASKSSKRYGMRMKGMKGDKSSKPSKSSKGRKRSKSRKSHWRDR